jgi:hypothetical protein
MALQTECGNELTERVCRDGMPIQSLVHAVPAGSYFLVIDSYSASKVEVQVDKAPPTAVTPVTGNDTCYNAVEIPETGGLFSGDTLNLQADYANCATPSRLVNDAAFKLTLMTGKRVVARVDTKMWDGMLMRFKAPESGAMLCSEMAISCNDDSDDHLPLLDESLPAGTYYYVITGYAATDAGQYTFDVSISDS